MACGRSVVATRIGGPPEFVPPEAGVLVDPTDLDDLERALRAAATMPRPNDAARAAAAEHDVRLQAQRVEELLELKRRNQTPIPLIEMFDALLSLDPRLTPKQRRKKSYEIMAAALVRMERKDA